jgi:2-dehydropantoate 2-reductase
MNILVYGAGAIGGYLGARLLHNGQQVTLLDRPEMAALINEEGLIVEEAGESIHVHPVVASSVAQAFAVQEPYDLILLALKSYDLPDALVELAKVEPQTAVMLTIGNGIGIEEPFISEFGNGRVLAGSLTTPVSKKSATHLVIERSDRGLMLAPTAAGQDVLPWVSMLGAAGINAASLDDYASMKWSKAFLNIVSNASSAILDMTPAQIYGDPRLFDLEVRMLRETLAVMKKQELAVINLPGSPAKTLGTAVKVVPQMLLKPILTRLVAGGRGDKMPSFYIDLVSGRGKSEVVYHNGAIAEAGEALGVATPVNRVLNDVLLGLTTGRLARETFAGQPECLLDAVGQQMRRSS